MSHWVEKFGLRSRHAERHAPRGGLAREVLEALIAEDLTVAAIADRVERSPSTVRHWLTFHGLRTSNAARRSRPRGTERGLRACAKRGSQLHKPRRAGGFRALASVRLEAAKCLLLCANCHAEVEAGVRSLQCTGRG